MISDRTLSSRTRSAILSLCTQEPIKNLARSYICIFKRLPVGGREMGGNKGEWAQDVWLEEIKMSWSDVK